MGWVSLTLRKQSLRCNLNSSELRDIQISREIRAIQRNLSHDQSIFMKNKKRELADAKEHYMELRAEKPDAKYGSNEYNEWYTEYQEAKVDYEEQKVEIEEYYEEILKELEEEATDKETEKQDEQTTLEAQLEAMRGEFDVVKEQISKDIQNSTPKFS